jgi:TetR/AcrR family transcriptional regulator, transcriptional repressor of bet genes
VARSARTAARAAARSEQIPGVRSAGTPRQRRSREDRRDELVEHTIDVLARRGYAGFRLADVARAAGVSTALLIVHFGSKEKLLIETLKRLSAEYFATLHGALESAGPRPADRLWHLVAAEFSPAVCTPRKLGAWKAFWSELNGRQPYLEHFGARTRDLQESIVSLCRSIVAEGGYEGHDPRAIGRLIDCALGGLWLDLTAPEGTTPITVHGARRAALAQLALFFPRHFTAKGPR